MLSWDCLDKEMSQHPWWNNELLILYQQGFLLTFFE